MRLSIFLSLAFMPLSAAAQEAPLDFWDEELRLFGTASAGQTVAHGLEQRLASSFENSAVSLDHADHVVGDLSLDYSPADAGLPDRFGFVSSLWGRPWSLADDMALEVWLKATDLASGDAWTVVLVDASGRQASASVPPVSGDWQKVSVPLGQFEAQEGFNWSDVRSVEFSAPVSPKTRINLDGAAFVAGETMIGITDKPLGQRMAEASDSRAARAAHAFRQEAMKVPEGEISLENETRPRPAIQAFAMMMAEVNLEEANQILINELKDSSVLTVWDLAANPLYLRFYYMFSSRAGKYPGRLTPEAEALLLETLWERTITKNDIALTRKSTWWMDGSENHDLNAKASSLVASRIFMNEPAYKDRVLPNYGYGGGYHYGHAGYYGPGIDFKERKGGGRADLSDGQDYTAADHYDAWVAYFNEYFRERAERGFFLEYGSPGYTKHTMGFVDLIYQHSGDDELKERVGDFVTLFWADWAQVSISGIRGGPKTRHHGKVGGPDDKGTADLVSFLLGGPGNPGTWWYWGLVNDYELPPVVWGMILDREGLGDFTYKARGIGEEVNELPRPLGAERAMLTDTDARFLKSTYVTPDYTLGTQMDHPLAVHSHLSITGRWHGMTFAQSPDARIVPVAIPDGPDLRGRAPGEYDTEIMMHTVHDRQTLIVQQSRRWTAIHPEWYPSDPTIYNRDVGVWFGDDWDVRTERNGWIFVQKGNAFGAVRPVLWDEPYERSKPSTGVGNQVFFNKPYDDPTVKLCDDCYSWNDAKTILKLQDGYSPIIIEAGDTEDYASIDDFMADVLDNPLALHKTVVPGFHVLVYTGLNGEEIVLNAGAMSIPTIGGEPISYEYGMTFDSPYMQSQYKSGDITLQYKDYKLQLDFSE
ncbi:hypothetical protein [Aquisalinus flavus]|uniref:Uncharacterized protein n=1 Tax=Aquisalinus flavus TaxID=1526572 RepID=A0A8J2V2L9_9PROT|nr:hypothetical protein [Aquisalinus flavus]MBD0425972.1 hypothetical protein [Aquisalinus flavus]UNE48436.1 hypothetical protein FF099_10445 [Aquisalinus flavus]GGD11771.1 hypothetical protein GCM10011342_20710 [Aquisalinus flavus]